MTKRYNITTDETRVPQEIEASDGHYVHAEDHLALRLEHALLKRRMRMIVASLRVSLDALDL